MGYIIQDRLTWSSAVIKGTVVYYRIYVSSFSPRNADGDTVPLLRETMTLIPVSINGTEKSMTSDLSSFMVREPTAM